MTGIVDPATDPTTAEPASSTSVVRWAATAVGMAVFSLIMLFAFGGGRDDEPSSRVLGQRVPELRGMPVEGLAGYSVDLAGDPVEYDVDDQRGTWVLVNFFATWCPPCIAEHPELVDLEAWGVDNELRIVAVVFNDPNIAGVQQFFSTQGGDWPVIDEPGVAIDFQIAQIPESFLVAPSGLVVEHYVGGLRAAEVIATVEELR